MIRFQSHAARRVIQMIAHCNKNYIFCHAQTPSRSQIVWANMIQIALKSAKIAKSKNRKKNRRNLENLKTL